MSTVKKLGAIALFSSLSVATHAANFNYNYGQIGFETGDVEGLALTGSFDINKDMFILGRFFDGEDDESAVDIDYSEYSIGAGYHMPINQKTDAVFTLSFHNAEVDVPAFGPFASFSDDDNGILVSAGVRHMINPQVELAGNIFHTTVFDGDTGFYGEARYNINSKMSAGLNFTSSETVDGLGINFRMGF